MGHSRTVLDNPPRNPALPPRYPYDFQGHPEELLVVPAVKYLGWFLFLQRV